MEPNPTPGQSLHDPDADKRRQAAADMGRAKTTRKQEAARINVAKAAAARKGKPMSEEHKAKIAASRLAQEAARKQAQAAPDVAIQEKKRPGRPRTRPIEEPTEKRSVGRPRKEISVNEQEGTDTE